MKKLNVLFSSMNDYDFVYLYTRFLHRYQDDLAEAFDLISNKFAEINEWLLNVLMSSDFHSNIEALTDAFAVEARRRKIGDPVLNPL